MRVVQIGTGGWGKNHARILSQLDVLVAICDADKQRCKEFGEKYSVNQYDSIDSLLSSEDFDAAVICTPTSTHAKIATQLIQAKKHVFVEKPMTYLSEEGEDLMKLAERNKVLLTCGYIERFNPAVGIVKDFVKSRKYGELVMLEFHRENRMPLHIKDVGIIYDTSVHDIDTAMWLFDDTPEVIFARAGKIRHEHEDFASIMLGFKDNKVAIISSNWITPTRVRTFNAVCTDAIISSDFITQEVKIETNNDTEIPRNEKKEPLLLELQTFLGAIEGKNELLVKAQHAVNVTKIAEAALLSSQKGTPIYLDLK
ncbi:gfo/Idh/MocA family oxidoreductase [Nitrosopumilus sp. b1]|uniref:Gfo/Idh/MocA family protein n=1 Tax=Nitrosopumilus sp. b1 TaxID=2109907 RepID=UPI0015F6F9CE|nr:Gfo/Idh/MocA family oxidoreductase [Nitrosopumilus sp. b1]KAF6243468.1 gfo/Idh/MocA family oxidoreductase [Nitrosopumilus sp. b1]